MDRTPDFPMTDDRHDPHPESFDDSRLPDPVPEGPGLFGDPPPAAPPPKAVAAAPYRVLARKYRPTTLDDLIGQDATVRILRNAFGLGRVAHAFMLTGVRGVGKTTTARIIARALNCIGADGKGGPTADPCGVCANCVAILADRHPDVIEMDAASRTGVDDVREIIEATRFRPMQARMKVFIIDEVHMLSRNAFNALLKTLEEPPAEVTFIFATTELRKVPVTVLSRCQRFDLRRVPQATLAAHFGRIADKEGVAFSDEALGLIARAADGSVRDGLSLLDQAIAQGTLGRAGEGAGARIEAPLIADMLGLADRELVFDLLDAVMRGQADVALGITDQAHARGADLGVMLGDLLEIVHTISRLKAIPALRDGAELPEAERVRGAAFADALSVPVLGRTWQMLLKGVAEVDMAPDRREAAEMVLIRLCHVADLPTPEKLVRAWQSGGPAGGGSPTMPTAPGGGPGGGPSAVQGGPDGGGTRAHAHVRIVANGGVRVVAEAPVLAPEPQPDVAAPEVQPLRSWREMVAFVATCREAMLHGDLRLSAHLVRFDPPEVAFRVGRGAPADLPRRLQMLLARHYGDYWRIRPSQEPGEPTIEEQGAEIIQLHRAAAEDHPLVKAIFAAYPDARMGAVRDHSLDEYGLPPEELAPAMLGGGHEDVPDLEFAPLDADLVDGDDLGPQEF